MHFLTYRISFVILISGIFNLISYAQTPDISQLEKAVGIVERYDYKGGFIGHGSGFVIKSDGTLVTNYHVIDLARYDGYVIKPKAAGLNINLGLGFRFGKVD
jgi:hypothetical protein